MKSIHKWFGCILPTMNPGKRQEDIDHWPEHFTQTNGFFCDKKNVSLATRLKFFDAMLTSVVCFAAGHQKTYTSDLRELYVHWQKRLQRITISPPSGIKLEQPRQATLHA